MEIKKIDDRDLVVSQRKKRNQDKKKTIFEIPNPFNWTKHL